MLSFCYDLLRSTVIAVVAIASYPLLAAEPSTAPKTATAVYVSYPLERLLDAKVEAVQRATVSAQTSGRVIKINYDVDDYVEAGDVLLQFRDREQKARFNSAQAQLNEAETEFKRIQDIFAKKLVAKAVLDKAEARFKSAQAALEQSREELENTLVRAPYSGIVVKRHIEVGETARVGAPLFTGISLQFLRASVELPQDMIATVRKLKRARVIVDRDGRSVSAESLRISPYADAESHTFNVRVNLPKGDYQIYPGMYTKVAFVMDEVRRLVIPASAIAYRSEVSAVYVLDKQDRISMRQVRLGRSLENEQVEILAGLSEGERVALDPIEATALLKEQQKSDT